MLKLWPANDKPAGERAGQETTSGRVFDQLVRFSRSITTTAVGSISQVSPLVFPITVRRMSTVLNTSESNKPNTVRACFVRRDGPMRVGIIEAHNGNSIAWFDQGQQLRPVRLLVGRRDGLKWEREARVETFVRSHSTVQWRSWEIRGSSSPSR